MGIHTGEPLAAPPKYVGIDVHKAARVMAAGHGGQVLVTQGARRFLSADVALVDLGVHRLKDLSQPEALYQLLLPGLRKEFPALKTLGNRPTNLPVVATPFIGRADELAEVQGLLVREQVRLLTLTGPGGIGKTRLALQAAAEASERFRDGVYWVPFAPIRDAALVAAAVVEALGLREEPGVPIAETLMRHLADKQLLLVLDNLEHVVRAGRDLVAQILLAAPQVRVVATSRERLRLVSEQLYDVPPLALPAGDVAEFEENDAVQLFVGRAQAADPTFGLSDANARTSVAEIVRRLEGLPLAIELAAARIRTLPLPVILDHLNNRLRLLTAGAYDADERQQTLRAAIQWSYDLLDASEQALLARLGVFVGGCRLDAVRAVCDPDGHLDELVDAVALLIDKSLLRRRDDPDGQPRYWMLETIREFALEKLASAENEHAATANRHAQWAAATAAALRPMLRSARTDEAIARLDAEAQNLRGALAFADATKDSQLFVHLVQETAMYWYLRGNLTEGVAYAERAVTLAEPLGYAVEAATIPTFVFLRAMSGDIGQAERALADRGVELAERSGDATLLLWALDAQAAMLGASGDVEASEATYRRCLDVANAANDRWFQMTTLSNLVDIALDSGRYEEALQMAEEAVARAHELADWPSFAIASANKGSALLALQRVSEARRVLEDAADVAESVGYATALGGATALLALIAVSDSNFSLAAKLIGYTEAALGESGVLSRRESHAYIEAQRLLALSPEPVDRGAFTRAGAEAARDRRLRQLLSLGNEIDSLRTASS
jgi:predicted ATPase